MVNKLIGILFGALFVAYTAAAQNVTKPQVSPKAYYLDAKNTWQESTKIEDQDAPLEVTFKANPQNLGEATLSYEWHFRKQGEEAEFLVRYEEETTYRFVESGTFDITLKATISETGEPLDSANNTISVAISESKLEFPNAFSPNDDDINDTFHAKEGYRSIVEFHAYIFNRWGQKLYEWTDPAGAWDGKYHGHYVKDGVYYLLVNAKGADGRVYNIRKDVNVLKGFNEGTSSSSTTTTE